MLDTVAREWRRAGWQWRVQTRLGRVPFVVVTSSRLAREVLKTYDAALAFRPALLSAQYLSFGCSDVTFSPAGPYWRQARCLCVSELLAPRRAATFRLIHFQEVHRLLRSISSFAAAGSDGQAIDLSAGFFQLSNDVLCRGSLRGESPRSPPCLPCRSLVQDRALDP